MNVFQNRNFGFCEKSNKYQLIIAIYLLLSLIVYLLQQRKSFFWTK